jgi:hypothetical protein
MDAFDFKDSKPKRQTSGLQQGWIWLLGAVYFLCMAVALIGYFGYTYTQPNNPYNPFPPGTQIAAVPTFTFPPSAVTDTPPGPPTATQPLEFPTFTTAPGVTPSPTNGLLPTQTEINIQTLTPTQPLSGDGPAFIIMDGNPLYLGHPDGCNGMYVAGNVVDINGAPLPLMLIRVQGILGGQSLGLEDTLSGQAQQYSESGWEIKLSANPIASTGTVWLELFDPVTEDAVSDLIFFDTFNDCSKNLIMINFVQVRP